MFVVFIVPTKSFFTASFVTAPSFTEPSVTTPLSIVGVALVISVLDSLFDVLPVSAVSIGEFCAHALQQPSWYFLYWMNRIRHSS